MSAEKLGSYIKNKRLDKHLTREKLAAGLSISASHLNAIERGLRTPSRDLMRSIAKELTLDTETLYEVLEGNEPGIDQPSDEPVKPKSRIPDLPPDDPPLSQEKLDLLNDPRIGLMFSMNTLGQLSNRQLNQIVSQIEFFLEENEELRKIIRGNKEDETSK